MSIEQKTRIREAIKLLAEWAGLEKQLRANKVSTKAIHNIKRIYLRLQIR